MNKFFFFGLLYIKQLALKPKGETPVQKRTTGTIVIAVAFIICLAAIYIANDEGRADVTPEYPITLHGQPYGTVEVDGTVYRPVESDTELRILFDEEDTSVCELVLTVRPYYDMDMETIRYTYVSERSDRVPSDAVPVQTSEPIGVPGDSYLYTDPLTGDSLTFTVRGGIVDEISFSGRLLYSNSGTDSFMEFDLEAGYSYYPNYVQDSVGPDPEGMSFTVSGRENGVELNGSVAFEPICSTKSFDDKGMCLGTADYYRVIIDIEGTSIPSSAWDSVMTVERGYHVSNDLRYLNGNVLTDVDITMVIHDDDSFSMYGEVRITTYDENCVVVGEENILFEYTGGPA